MHRVIEQVKHMTSAEKETVIAFLLGRYLQVYKAYTKLAYAGKHLDADWAVEHAKYYKNCCSYTKDMLYNLGMDIRKMVISQEEVEK